MHARRRAAAHHPKIPEPVPVEHILYIPGILLVGLAIGYVLGARAARAEYERRRRERRK